jgi:hypothetical protein
MADYSMKSSIKHNKLRNTGILFELLVRQITADVLENKQQGVAVQLMREFFNSKTELGKELMLYRAFFNVQNLSETKAFQLLKLVTEQRKTLNQKVLDTQKYQLIKEIKKNFDLKEFFSARIPSYKIYASIYKNFDAAMNGIGDATTIEELASSQFTIVEHLSGKISTKEIKEHNELASIIRNQPKDTRFLSYKILIERFNEKYKELDANQKKLLQEYIYNIPNTTKLKEYANQESKKLAKALLESSYKITDTIVRIKLSEVITQLEKIQTAQVIKENHMTALLIGHEILKEIKSL